MSTIKPVHEWTQEEVETFLKELNSLHWRERLATFAFTIGACIAGAFGNSLTFVVYLTTFPNNSTRIFVLGLSVTDFTVNVLGAPLGFAMSIFFYTFYSDSACKMFILLQRTLLTSSVLLLGLIAFDRYLHVCRPHSKQLGPRCAMFLVFAACAGGIGLSVPFLPIYGVSNIDTSIPGINGSNCGYVPEKVSPTYFLVDHWSTGIIFVTALALMLFCYVNIGIHVAYSKSALARKSRISRSGAPVSSIRTQSTHDFPVVLAWEANIGSKVTRMDQKSTTVDDDDFESTSVDSSSVSDVISAKKQPRGVRKPSLDSVSVGDDTTDNDSKSEVTTDTSPRVRKQATPAPMLPLQDSDIYEKHEIDSEEKVPNIASSAINLELNQTKPVTSTDIAGAETDMYNKNINKLESSSSSSSSESTSGESISDTEIEPTNFERFRDRAFSILQRRGWPLSKYKISNTTRMMIILTLFFVLFFLPYVFVMSITPPHKIPCQGLPIVELNFCEMAIYYFPVLNSVVNPFVYSMFSYRFRQECKRYLCWFRKS